MLLESITLENFRQFRHESIDFAQGENGKNVTIIIGENGTGKTTFAQAFFWCMYGETEFSDKNMLNKLVANEMKPGQEQKVQVTLKLRHGNVSYTLMREQVYRKDYSNKVKGDNTVFDIAIKDANGNTSYVKKAQCESEVKGILPKELSRYFFFDGERIEKMSKDINEIFKQIYDGGLYLTIDEKYHISVYVNEYDGDVETSTAQSISVIFAFITGIIKMARDNRNATDDNAKLLSSEPYPLVMDAPLSAFDKRRIKTVCEALPNTAEQVIIFIKDTDGELAEEHMGDKIGCRHYFDKKNEFETVLV